MLHLLLKGRRVYYRRAGGFHYAVAEKYPSRPSVMDLDLIDGRLPHDDRRRGDSRDSEIGPFVEND